MAPSRVVLAALTALLVLSPRASVRAGDEATPPASASRIAELVTQLGADEFPARERASRELIQLGEAARPALEKAKQDSENLEVRWRADQILKRLDQEGARPLGPAPIPPTAPPPGAPDDPLGRDDLPERARTRLEAMQRQMEEMRRLFEERFGSSGFGPSFPSETLEASGLELEIDRFGMDPNLTLRVTEEGHPAMTYRGRSLEAILERNPQLEQHPGMADLKKRWNEYKRMHPSIGALDGLFGGQGFLGGSRGRISIGGLGEGFSISQDESGTTVTVTERDEDGKTVTRTYTGEDLDAIKRDHPELKERLDRFTIQIGPMQVFGAGPGGRRLPPLAPPVRPVDPPTRPPGFGVVVGSPDAVLASQLKLVPEQALLVLRVLPGSPAESMGVQLHDIIVGIDDQPVPGSAAGVELLRRAAATDAPLTLDVIRHGERIRLTR